MTGRSPRPAPSPALLTTGLLLLICVLGIALRFYGLGELPPGLYQDEAYNGLDALAVLDGARPLYFPANNGREPLYIYLSAASISLLGRTALALRLPAAILGALTVPATFALGAALFNRRVGLWAAAIVAVTFWPLALSRIGLRAVGLPLLAALSLAAAAWAWRRATTESQRRWALALAGGLYGLTFYTYLAARFTPLALSAFFIFWYIAHRRTFPTVRQLAAFGLPALLVALPLGLAALQNPEILFGRTGQVSILNPAIHHGNPLGTLFHNSLAALGMFVWRGDDIARHNLPGRPVFDPVLGLAFVVGVVLAVRGLAQRASCRPAYALPLIWTATLLLPTVLAEDTPHFLRAAGVLPFIFLFPALALDALWQFAWRPHLRLAGRALAVALLAGGAAFTVRDYFGRYTTAPDTAYLFQAAAAELARTSDVYLTAEAGRRLYLDRRFPEQFASVRFLLAERPGLRLFSEGEALGPDTGPLRVVIWPYEDMQPALRVLPAHAWIEAEYGPLYRGDLEANPYPLYATYTVHRLCPGGQCGGQSAAEFSGGFRLRWAAVREDGNGATLELAWEASAAPMGDVHVFAHAVVAGEIVAQADGLLGSELYPARWWRAGEQVLEQRRFDLPPGVELAEVEFHVGLYDPGTGARVPRADAPSDRAIIVP